MPTTQDSQVRHEHGTRRVVQHGRASTTTSIAEAIVIKHDELFFLCDQSGDVPFEGSHGFGLYYHDCRYLDGYELRLAGDSAERLASSAASGSWATFELTNRDFEFAEGRLVEKERIALTWERTLDAEHCALHDSLTFTNFSVDPVQVPITIRMRTVFDALFEVRGAEPQRRGSRHDPIWDGATLRFRYDGADGLTRTLDVSFDPAPRSVSGGAACFELPIDAHGSTTLSVSLQVRESDGAQQVRQKGASNAARTRRTVEESRSNWMRAATSVHSDSEILNAIVDRALRDLHLLRTTLNGRGYFAAGVPWYVTLFGRDSLIAAIEALAFMPDAAEDTLRLLASYQGTRHDTWRDEAPGKIMHEIRFGEMAHLDEVPQTPYYGSVDATPLFLILIARHAEWTGRLDLFTELRANVEAALRWIDETSQTVGAGYLAYTTTSKKGLANQGWKDSGDSIVNRDGSLVEPPIALVEVQGYVYMAKHEIARLFRRAGNSDVADRIAKEAEELREHFERDFWIDELGTYALALQKENRRAAVVSSNAGQALWTGIVASERAARVAERLMRNDMFSGWGVRTLASGERRYNPVGYHDGTVWPHDNAIIVSGLRRYGCLAAAVGIISGIMDAATHFAHQRLPEVFAGFSREEFPVPVRYPVACHPQAWAAGSVPFMLQAALGLTPDAFNRRLHVASPVLPSYVQRLTLDRLRVGEAVAHLELARGADGRMTVQDVKTNGHLDVLAE
jgi:glycogen debranching enzyme